MKLSITFDDGSIKHFDEAVETPAEPVVMAPVEAAAGLEEVTAVEETSEAVVEAPATPEATQ